MTNIRKQNNKKTKIKLVSLLLIMSIALCSCSTDYLVVKNAVEFNGAIEENTNNIQTLSSAITYLSTDDSEVTSDENIEVVGDNIVAIKQNETYIFEAVEKDGYTIINMYNEEGELVQQSSIEDDTNEITELYFNIDDSEDEVSESQLEDVMEKIAENPTEDLDFDGAEYIKSLDGDKYISFYEEEDSVQDSQLTDEEYECIHKSENILLDDAEYSNEQIQEEGNIQLGCIIQTGSESGSAISTSSKTSHDYLINEPMLSNSGLTKNSSLDGYYYLGRNKYNGHYGYVSRKVYTSDMKNAKRFSVSAGVAATSLIGLIWKAVSKTIKYSNIVSFCACVIVDGIVICAISGDTGYKTKHYIYKVQVDGGSKVWYYYCRSRNYWYIAAYDKTNKKNYEKIEYWKTNHGYTGSHFENIQFTIDYCYGKNKVIDATC